MFVGKRRQRRHVIRNVNPRKNLCVRIGEQRRRIRWLIHSGVVGEPAIFRGWSTRRSWPRNDGCERTDGSSGRNVLGVSDQLLSRRYRHICLRQQHLHLAENHSSRENHSPSPHLSKAYENQTASVTTKHASRIQNALFLFNLKRLQSRPVFLSPPACHPSF